MRHEESQIQIAFINWIALQYPHLHRYIMHIPNGGKMSLWKGQHLKRMGVQPGVADIFFMWAHGKHHGLWLEFKTKKGVQSDTQKAFELRCIVANYEYKVAHSLEEAMGIFKNYLGEKT